MKSKNKKRILALVLSMVLMLSTGISAMAEGEAGKGTTSGKTVTDQDTAGEKQDSSKEMETETAEGEKPGEIEKVTETPVQTEPAGENVTEEIVSEAADLYQDFKDEDGNVITTIHAYVPEGAFQAKADQISMEAKLLDSDSENYIKGMMEEKLPENSYLGGYVLYEVNFMVDGVITEPAKAITLTIEGSGLSVTDLSKTKAFYYDPADPETEGDEDQLIDMGQKADVLNYLVENGVAEDQINTYEYSELDVQNEVAHQIGFNTWKSTIYGCYTEAYSAETTFTQEVDGVIVNVTAPEGAFPTAAENVSFTAAAVTEEQDTVISSQLDAKAEELEQEVKGYEAFVLSFTVNGEEMQPQVPVSVSFENTGLPAEDVNGAQSFQLDEENRAVNELEGTVENGTASMTLSQMGTVGYWAYGDAVIEEEDSTSPEDEDTPDGTEEKQPEDSVEEDSEAVTDESQGGTDQKEDGLGSTDGTQDAEDTEEKEDNNEDTSKEDTDLEADSEENKKQEEDTNNIEETGSDKEEIEKENSEDKEEAAEEEEKDSSEDKKNEPDEKTDNEKEETSEDVVKKEKESTEETVKGFTYEDDSVVITVSAEEEGIIPEGAELSVTPIEKTEITEDMSEEEKAEAEKINEQYSFTEEKLNEESEANEEVMEGFLAYDICFLVDGEEVEPSGDVQVVMDFKEAAIPEGVSEDAEVSVKHLKEEVEAEDGVVVEDMTEKSEVQTTEKAAVEKVELTAESFSIFTITWGSGRNSQSITVYYVNENGRQITDTRTQNVDKDSGEWVRLSDYAGNIDGYLYAGAHLGSADGTAVKQIRYDSKNWYYKNTDDYGNGERWRNSNEKVYLVYETEPDTITTVDTKDFIDISLYDYATNASFGGLKFNGSGSPFYNNWIGYSNSKYNGTGKDNYAVQGIVASRLYGATAENNWQGDLQIAANNNASAAGLFDEDQLVASGLTHLFTKDKNGYYEYDSAENYAYYPGSGEDFKVYKDYKDKGKDGQGDFMPLTTPSGTAEWYYGMTVGFNFIQPKDGKVNNQDMIFSFSGDDDVWVFVDGQLVLDLGGIHGAVEGTINFATGEVSVPKVVPTSESKLSNTLNPGGNSTTIGNIFGLAGSTFEDYSEHRLEFIYLERGAGESNCKLRFNIPAIPRDGIRVAKLIDNYDEGAYSDVEFQFELYLDKNGDDEVSDSGNDNEKITGADEKLKTYIVKDMDDETGAGDTRTLGEDGIFTLKHHEVAIFSDIEVTTKYKVREVGVSSEEYDDIKITSGVTDQTGDVDLDNSEDHSGYAESKVLQVGSNLQAVFHNRCNPTNMKQLYIKKELRGVGGADETYRVQVIVGGEPYKGDYLLGTSSGAGRKGNTQDGWISFKAGQVITVLGNVSTEDGKTIGFPSGTTFEVVEGNLNPENFFAPTYEITENTAEINSTEGKASGVFVLDKNAEVIVTNNVKGKALPDNPYIEIQKTFEGLEKSQIPKNFKIELYKNKTDSEPVKVLALQDGVAQDDLTYTWRCYDLAAGTYYVKESGENVEGYTLTEVKINGETVESGGITITTQKPEFVATRVNDQINSNRDTEFSFDENNFIAASLKDQRIFVWTEDALSYGEREAIIEVINTSAQGNLGGKATMENTIFYSTIDNLEEGIAIGDGTIYVQNGYLKFTKTSQWQHVHVIAGKYEVKNAVNAEIEVVNTYTPKEVDIDLQKYGSDYSMDQLTGAKFSLYQGIKEEKPGSITWSEEPMENYSAIEVTAENCKELKLKDGYYKLVETTAPGGYVLLEDSIYFKVEDQKVVLIHENGNNLSNNKADMWEVDKNGLVIKIKNEALYDLPSAGGSGIFLYMIGGTLLLIAGSLMIYINRRREVLRK